MWKTIIEKGWQYSGKAFDKAKSYFRKDKKEDSSSDRKNDKGKEDKEKIEEKTREQVERISANNGRSDGKTWDEVISEDQPTTEAVNDKIGKEHSKGLGDISNGATGVLDKKSIDEIIEERRSQIKDREEKLKADKTKNYEERDQERREKLEDKKQEREANKDRTWEEKEQIRRGTFEETNDPNNQEFTTLEEQERNLQTRQMDLLKSNSNSYFLPESSLSATAIAVDNNREGALDLLKKEDYTTPQEIIDEWKERRGSPINGGEYYQIHGEIEPKNQTNEEREYSDPPMSLDADLDGGEDGASDGGTDGGSDGGGDGGGE